MKHNLTIENPKAEDLVIALVQYYNGENLIKDFPKLLKEMIMKDYYKLLKTESTRQSIYKLAAQYKVSERLVTKYIYN